MDDAKARLTARTRQILVALLEDPTAELALADVCRATNLPSGTAAPLLGRLIHYGYVADRRHGNRRLYRVDADQVDAAREVLTASQPATAANGADSDHIPTTAHTTAPVERVWTVREIEQAVAAGSMPAAVLRAVRAEIPAPTR